MDSAEVARRSGMAASTLRYYEKKGLIASTGRQGAVPRWMGITSLVLGGPTVVSGVLPVQYMAIVPGALWVLVISVGFLAGDKTHRSGN